MINRVDITLVHFWVLWSFAALQFSIFLAFRSKFFGRPVFIDSVVWFRANGPTSYLMIDTIEFSLYLYFKHAAALNTKLTLSCCKRVVCISVYVLREQWLRE